MTTEEQRCKVCGRLGCYGATEKCYRLGYTRANERAEGLQAELAVAWADCADGSCRACSECCDSLREQLTEAREALEDVLKGAATAEARAESLQHRLERANESARLLSLEANEQTRRAEGLAKELETLRAQMATTLVFAPPDATHKCAGKCGTFWDCRYNAAQKDCPNCGGQLIPAAQASSAATARVAELEKQLAAGVTTAPADRQPNRQETAPGHSEVEPAKPAAEGVTAAPMVIRW